MSGKPLTQYVVHVTSWGDDRVNVKVAGCNSNSRAAAAELTPAFRPAYLGPGQDRTDL
jgi:hypothetical protein